MYNDVLIVVPLYNGEKTILNVLRSVIDQGFDHILVCDDFSTDQGVAIIRENYPDIPVIVHLKNEGYGKNQKSLYNYAVEKTCFNYVIMVHGDGQYNPKLCRPIAEMLKTGIYDVILASRIITSGALKNGMPLYKYISNRVLTLLQNIVTNSKLSEYHTGYRAYTTEVLREVKFDSFSNKFIFDNQMLLQIIKQNFNIGEISCPTVYTDDSSSISFRNSVAYGMGVVKETILYRLKN